MTIWVVRVVDDAAKETDALKMGVCITGWDKLGDFKSFLAVDTLKEALRVKYPEKNNFGLSGWASQVISFRDRIKIGDIVLMPSKVNPVVYVGAIESDYKYAECGTSTRHIRNVKWSDKPIRKNELGDVKGSMGAFLSVFKIENSAFEDQLKNHLS